MQKIPNQNMASAEEIFARIEPHFPGSKLKKPFLSPKTVLIPVQNYKLLVRIKKDFLVFDLMPPVLWSVMGMVIAIVAFSLVLSMFVGQVVGAFGALVIICGFLVAKGIFKSRNKDEIDRYNQQIEKAVNNYSDNSIF